MATTDDEFIGATFRQPPNQRADEHGSSPTPRARVCASR
jgi:hypothetical protein